MSPDLIKRIGSGAFIRGDQLREFSHSIIRVSPKIDVILGGGIPGGTVVTLAGQPKCGKTVTALYIGAKGQAQGRPLFYINVEGRIKPRDLDGIRGLNQSEMTIVRSYRDDENNSSRILTAEEFLDTVEWIAHNKPRAVIIIDSISQLATDKEQTSDMGDRLFAPGTVLLSQLTKKLANVIPVNDVILIGIQHITSNFNTMGRKTTITGGNKIKYAADIALECKYFKFLREGAAKKEGDGEDEGSGKVYGQKVCWLTTCTAIAPPGMTTESIIKYGIGIDEVTEMSQVAQELGFIARNGAWYKLIYLLDSMPEKYKDESSLPKAQGEANLVALLEKSPEEYKALEKAIADMLK